MTEILTESFCERCGTRYTFESAAPTRQRLRGLKVIGRGLKNFVMSDDASLDEALAAARSEDEYEVTTHQLDAFHRTFNFCMSCRQYTCENCWDPVEARCLTCAPNGAKAQAIAAAEAAAAAAAPPAPPFALSWPSSDLATDGAAEPVLGQPDDHAHGELIGAESPAAVAELSAAAASESDQVASPDRPGTETVEAAVEPEVSPAADVIDEPVAAQAEVVAQAPEIAEPVEAALPAEPEGIIEPVEAAPLVEATPAAPAPAIEAEPPTRVAERAKSRGIGRYRPGQSLDAEIAAYEAAMAAGTVPEKGPEAPDAATEVGVVERAAGEQIATQPVPAEPVAAEPVAAEAPAPEPEPVAAEPVAAEAPAPEPVAAEPPAPEPEPPAAPPVQPAAPAAVPFPIPGPVGPAPAPTKLPPPAWPTRATWPTPALRDATTQAPIGDPLAAALARRATDAMWAQSANDLLRAQPLLPTAQQPTAAVQSCQSCGLSLSATARFCRRCGARQDG